jgi:hypothetical protein
MALRSIPFPLSSAPGEYPGEGAGRLINAFAEPLGPEAASPMAIKRVPGLTTFGAAPNGMTGWRGFLEVNGVVWAVIGTQLFYFDSNGTPTFVANVAGTKRVFMARNNKTPTPDKVLVSENGAFVFTDIAVTAYPDADLPQPTAVDAQDGYLIFPIADGRVFATDLNALTVNALSFAKAESKPDGLYRAIAYDNQMLFFGPSSTEFWVDTANTPPAFPYSRSTAKSYGLASATAIAGHENGFSSEDSAPPLMWVSDSGRVVRLRGTGIEAVSSPDLDRLIAATTDKTQLEASVYVAGGVRRWVLTGPSWTWEFSLNTQKWNERASFQSNRWTGSGGVFVSGKWVIGDRASGKIYVADHKARKEGDNPLRFRVESGEVQDFPNRTRVARVDFDIATGVGSAMATDPDEINPVGEYSYSDDGGAIWTAPQQFSIGQQGHFETRITLTRQGTSGPRGRRHRIDISSPVYAGLVKGTQSSNPRNA